jgi:hypothetical protein
MFLFIEGCFEILKIQNHIVILKEEMNRIISSFL